MKSQNVVGFHLANALGKMVEKNIETNAQRFTLKDKANLRNMLIDSTKNQAKAKKSLVKLQKEVNRLGPLYAEVEQLFNQNSSLTGQLDSLNTQEKILDQRKVSLENSKNEIIKQIRDLKARIDEMKALYNKRKGELEASYSKNFQNMQNKIDQTTKEVEKLKVQTETHSLSKKMMDASNNQTLKAQIFQIKHKIKDFEYKSKSAGQENTNFLNNVRKEYNELQADWVLQGDKKSQLVEENNKIKRKQKQTQRTYLELCECIETLQNEIQQVRFESTLAQQQLRVKASSNNIDRMLSGSGTHIFNQTQQEEQNELDQNDNSHRNQVQQRHQVITDDQSQAALGLESKRLNQNLKMVIEQAQEKYIQLESLLDNVCQVVLAQKQAKDQKEREFNLGGLQSEDDATNNNQQLNHINSRGATASYQLVGSYSISNELQQNLETIREILSQTQNELGHLQQSSYNL